MSIRPRPQGRSRFSKAVGIGHVAGVETRAFIGDLHFKAIGEKSVGDADFLGGVHLVAMFDGVDQGFLQGQLDAEDVVVVDVTSEEKLFDVVLNPARLGRIAGDGDIQSNRLTDIALGVSWCRQQLMPRMEPP